MKKYFKIIGYFSLIIWLISFIALIVQYAKLATPVTVGGYKTGGLTSEGHFYYVMLIIASLVFGPSLSLLFIYTSKLEDGFIHLTKDNLKYVRIKSKVELTLFDTYFKINNHSFLTRNISNLNMTNKSVTFMDKIQNTIYGVELDSEEDAKYLYDVISECLKPSKPNKQ